MFLGEFRHTIDDKGRLTIPAKFRGELASGLVLAIGFDRNLMVYSQGAFEMLAEKIRAKSITDRRVREFSRRLFPSATDLIPDRQGRIVIPGQLRSFAGIETDVYVTGMNEFVEIWAAEAWQTMRTLLENPADAEYLQDLGF